MTSFYDAGFPHSDIHGSLPAHGSPRLFAVYHVLLRHLTPRHPPQALSSLISCDAEKLTFFTISSFAFAILLLMCTPLFSGGGLTAKQRALVPDHTSRLSIPLSTLQPGRLPGCLFPFCLLPVLLIVDASLPYQYALPQASLTVEMRGLEPLTYALQRHRSPS